MAMPRPEPIRLSGATPSPDGFSAQSTPVGIVDPESALAELQVEIGDCTRCRLCEKRTRLVFGSGNPRARILFVGEEPRLFGRMVIFVEQRAHALLFFSRIKGAVGDTGEFDWTGIEQPNCRTDITPVVNPGAHPG